jgi:hypothetical protein
LGAKRTSEKKSIRRRRLMEPTTVEYGRKQNDGFLATKSESGRSIVQVELHGSTRRD